MRTFIPSLICLLVGLSAGFFVGYRYYERHITSEATQQMIQGMESSQRLAAARGVRAIELIQSGQTQQAIRMFSVPVADFYSWYAPLAHNDEETKKLLVWIEQAASTNAAVASAIHSKNQ
jgi:hypothetical protein